jgi:hypothetical protein
LRALLRERGLNDENYAVRAVRPDEAPAFLCAADAGLAFIKPCFSKLASSPTKTAEYLGCGLPLVINAGIGDADALVTEEQAGALVTEFTPAAYAKAARTVFQMSCDDATRARMRGIAARLLNLQTVGLPRYANLYAALLDG